MLILLPLPDRRPGGWPWLSTVVLGLMLLLHAAEVLLGGSGLYVASQLAQAAFHFEPSACKAPALPPALPAV